MMGDSKSYRVRWLGVLVAACCATLPASATGSGQNTASREFQKTLTLSENQTLSVQNKFGDVHVHGGNGREVRI